MKITNEVIVRLANMKIAIVMAGYPRTYKTCLPKFLENFVFEGNSGIDFYLHFYDSEANEDVLAICNPTDWICEKEHNNIKKYQHLSFNNPRHGDITNYKYNTYSQFKNNLLAFSLVPDNKYDVVVKTRYDLLLDEQFDFSTLDMNSFNIPVGGDHQGLNDRFCISSYENMKLYFNFFKKIDFINQNGNEFHPECMLAAHLANLGKNIHRFSCAINNIIR